MELGAARLIPEPRSCRGCRADYPAGAPCRRCLSVANFDRERLRAILNSAGIDASKKNIKERRRSA